MKALSILILASLPAWLPTGVAAQAAVRHFEIEIALSMDGAVPLTGSAIVERGKQARFTTLAPGGKSGSRIDLTLSGVDVDARGRPFAVADARVFEKRGDDWILRAEPKVFPLLGAVAHANVGASQGAAPSGALDLRLKVTAVGAEPSLRE